MLAASLDAPLEDVQIPWNYKNAQKTSYTFNSAVGFGFFFLITEVTFSCFYRFELTLCNLILLDFR